MGLLFSQNSGGIRHSIFCSNAFSISIRTGVRSLLVLFVLYEKSTFPQKSSEGFDLYLTSQVTWPLVAARESRQGAFPASLVSRWKAEGPGVGRVSHQFFTFPSCPL